ncbi:hypothetical protein CKAH01_12471 [Colletotrichum kahawae]|uniref:Uncharacterized protein n=1 Tax=Colletotrichum kahawae TaxID=34407 RepID=A0AAD9YQQ5_COLKA|nr:hypothetical protein CKAH01_12471 [Colletotrichum kahawae]
MGASAQRNPAQAQPGPARPWESHPRQRDFIVQTSVAARCGLDNLMIPNLRFTMMEIGRRLPVQMEMPSPNLKAWCGGD